MEQSTSRRSRRPRHLSERSLDQTAFDRFAGAASDFVSRAFFFTGCVLICVIWAPSIAVIKQVNTWQLVINTFTTIVTFLMVALLQNSQRRGEEALQKKLNAVARGIEDLLELHRNEDPGDVETDIRDLRTALGLEDKT